MSQSPSTGSLLRISTLCELGRFADAARAAGRYLQTDPHDVQALCLLAWARLETDDPAGALDAARGAMAAGPPAEWPHRLASIALHQLGCPAEAVAEAEAAVGAAPFDAMPRVQLANAGRAHGVDLPAARRAADEAVALAPHLVEAHLAVGAVAAVQGRRADAEAAFRAALRLDPECAAAHHNLARLRLGGRHPADAAGLAAAASGFATALRADPTTRASRRSLDLVVFDVVQRMNFFVLVAGLIGIGLGAGTSEPRAGSWLPLALMAVPIAFARQFVVRLTPALRAHLLRGLRRPWPGLPVAAFALAAVVLALGAAVPELGGVAFPGAALIAILVRVGLWAHGRNAGFVVSPRRRAPRAVRRRY